MRFTSMDTPQIRELFASAMTMFRIERLPAYGPTPTSTSHDLDQWCERVHNWTGHGRIVQRVRVLADPLTDYMRYQLEQVFPATVQAGEDVRILAGEGPWSPAIEQDFWLFNGTTALILDHSRSGELVFADLLDTDEVVAAARGVRDRALAAAVPWDRYVQGR